MTPASQHSGQPVGRLDELPRLTPQQIRFERTQGGLVKALLVTSQIEPVDFY